MHNQPGIASHRAPRPAAHSRQPTAPRLGLQPVAGATAALAAAALLAGCAGVSSVPIGSSKDNRLGVVYYLPTTLIPLSVAVDRSADRITISAEPPVYLADKRQPLRLISRYSSGHAEEVGFAVDKETQLLSSVNLTSDGRLDEIAVAAARSAALALSPESTPPTTGQTVIGRYHIDVEELTEHGEDKPRGPALTELNRLINAALSRTLAGADKGFLGRAARTASRGRS